jgi:hypothetical protein
MPKMLMHSKSQLYLPRSSTNSSIGQCQQIMISGAKILVHRVKKHQHLHGVVVRL